MATITAIKAREILDSRGNPTLEVDVLLDSGQQGRAAVPAGASSGLGEAHELRDGGTRYGGKGVQRAMAHVLGPIAQTLVGHDPANLGDIDTLLLSLDGTPDKSRLGANAMLGVSMAVARAGAASRQEPLYQFLACGRQPVLPVPMFNVLNGGAHADNDIDFQEFMIAPVGASSFSEALRQGAEVYHALKARLHHLGLSTAVGDEGGFAPALRHGEAAIEVILRAITDAGLTPGIDVVLALDPAASELYQNGEYVFKKAGGVRRSSEDLIALYGRWLGDYSALWSIEDGLGEEDWDGWQALTRHLGQRLQLVGDDIFVTTPAIIRQAITRQVANASLIKLNQIGTVTETLQAIDVTLDAGYGAVISHRSGETSDDFIADLAVASAVGQIKSGAPARGERTAKYNQLLRIEQELGDAARYAGAAFSLQGSFLRRSAR